MSVQEVILWVFIIIFGIFDAIWFFGFIGLLLWFKPWKDHNPFL